MRIVFVSGCGSLQIELVGTQTFCRVLVHLLVCTDWV
jgi:hypothetical protein